MRGVSANHDATALALCALAWTLEDPARAARLLALTGLDPRQLRAAADTPPVLVAVIDFLAGQEADLIACAAALGAAPEALIAARDALERR